MPQCCGQWLSARRTGQVTLEVIYIGQLVRNEGLLEHGRCYHLTRCRRRTLRTLLHHLVQVFFVIVNRDGRIYTQPISRSESTHAVAGAGSRLTSDEVKQFT